MRRGSCKTGEARPGGVRGAAMFAALVVVVTLVAPTSAGAAPAAVSAKLRTATAPKRQLDRVDAVTLPGGATVYRYQQRVGGVPVLGGQAVVNDPVGGPPELVADSSHPRVAPQATPRIRREEAVATAVDSTGARQLRGKISARTFVQPNGAGRLVWRVIVPSGRPLGDFEVLVDAASGEVVRTRDLLRRTRRGHAKLFNPNPVVEHEGLSGLEKDRRDRDTRLLTSLRVRATLHGIKDGQHCLRGQWVHAKVGRHPAHEVCKPGLRWNSVRRAKDRFEGLMAYFHVDRAQRYIQRLGFHGQNGINDRPQIVVADAFREDNSFFSPATRRIKYGSGGVDDAEDADVILHEYGHAIQDAQEPGFGTGSQAGAIGEGFGDYWAAVMSSRLRGTRNRDNVCIFDWDGVTWGSFVDKFNRRCGRRADRNESLPRAQDRCSLDIHCVGEAWSSALWALRTEYGINPIAFDRIVLASQFMYTTPHEPFDEAVDALVTADQDLPGGGHQDEICHEMETNRRIDAASCP